MKPGVIIYIACHDDLAEDFDSQKALADLDCQADQVGMVSSKLGYFDVPEALFSVIVKGCGRINLLIAQADGSDYRQCLKPPIHLNQPDASPDRKKLIAASNLAIAFGRESIRPDKTNLQEGIT